MKIRAAKFISEFGGSAEFSKAVQRAGMPPIPSGTLAVWKHRGVIPDRIILGLAMRQSETLDLVYRLGGRPGK